MLSPYVLAGLLRNGDTVTSVGLKSVPASTMVKQKPLLHYDSQHIFSDSLISSDGLIVFKQLFC
jgi:hypothetical protein